MKKGKKHPYSVLACWISASRTLRESLNDLRAKMTHISPYTKAPQSHPKKPQRLRSNESQKPQKKPNWNPNSSLSARAPQLKLPLSPLPLSRSLACSLARSWWLLWRTRRGWHEWGKARGYLRTRVEEVALPPSLRHIIHFPNVNCFSFPEVSLWIGGFLFLGSKPGSGCKWG